MNLDEQYFGYRRGYELFDFFIQDRIFLKNMSVDLLKRSIISLKYEKRRRKKESK